MKIKKGEVYMFKKSREWFRVIDTNPNSLFNAMRVLVKFDDNYTLCFSTWYVEDEIKKGKLIKIPQLYK